MSESNDTSRPWHGKDNPMEALYDWVKAEMAGVHDKLDRVKALVAPVATPVAPEPVVPAPGPVPPVAEPAEPGA